MGQPERRHLCPDHSRETSIACIGAARSWTAERRGDGEGKLVPAVQITPPSPVRSAFPFAGERFGHRQPVVKIPSAAFGQLDGKLVCWFAGSMKTTLDLPDDLVRELKLRSVHERRKLKDVAAAALRRGLQAEPPVPAANEPLPPGLEINERGFPVFKCGPDAPASKMTVEELLALEQESLLEEDLKRAGIAR